MEIRWMDFCAIASANSKRSVSLASSVVIRSRQFLCRLQVILSFVRATDFLLVVIVVVEGRERNKWLVKIRFTRNAHAP